MTRLESITPTFMARVAGADSQSRHLKPTEKGALRPKDRAPSTLFFRTRRFARQLLTQYESELITSPALIEPSATHVIGLIEFFMKRTEPSPKRLLTPPGCRLRVPVNSPPCCPWA